MFPANRNLFAIAILLFSLPAMSGTESKVSIEAVSFAAATMVDGDARVKGELRTPAGNPEKIPAVVVIHNAAGLSDRTGSAYIEALNAAGIATLELDLFTKGNAPASTRGHIPHTYGSLIFLANHPRIDKDRIGIMGFSYGAILSMVTASSDLTATYTGGSYRFAAHLPLYFPCWTGTAVIDGKIKSYNQNLWNSTTGSPILILAGDKDDYGDPDMCPKFVEALPESARKHTVVMVYPGAFHGWDTFEDRTYFDKFAFGGKGGTVRHFRNPDIAEKSKAATVQFFKNAFDLK